MNQDIVPGGVPLMPVVASTCAVLGAAAAVCAMKRLELLGDLKPAFKKLVEYLQMDDVKARIQRKLNKEEIKQINDYRAHTLKMMQEFIVKFGSLSATYNVYLTNNRIPIEDIMRQGQREDLQVNQAEVVAQCSDLMTESTIVQGLLEKAGFEWSDIIYENKIACFMLTASLLVLCGTGAHLVLAPAASVIAGCTTAAASVFVAGTTILALKSSKPMQFEQVQSGLTALQVKLLNFRDRVIGVTAEMQMANNGGEVTDETKKAFASLCSAVVVECESILADAAEIECMALQLPIYKKTNDNGLWCTIQ